MRNRLIWVLFMSFAVIAVILAATVNGPPVAGSLPIKIFLTSADSPSALQEWLIQRHIVLDGPLTLPDVGQPVHLTGTGSSGIQGRYLLERSLAGEAGMLHLYAERARPQHPIHPLPYREQEVVFDTPDPAVAPVGTLSIPVATQQPSAAVLPAVVLLAGSGAQPRDGNISLHKTMAVLADHLARKGFVVLRYDKRGVGLSGGVAHPGSTLEDYTKDALAALRFLRIQPQVDPNRIGLVGHSEGGLVATLVAAQAPTEVNFVAMLGAPALYGVELKSRQDAQARRADGVPESLVLANQLQERELFEIAAGDLPYEEAAAAMQAATLALPIALKTQLEIPSEGIPVEAFEGLLTPWMRSFLRTDPKPSLRRLRMPLLALQGEKDLQVPANDNLPVLRQALEGNREATVVVLSGLNHLLQQAPTGRDVEYLLLEQTMAPQALTTLSDWLILQASPVARDHD
jgi:pimeloyl-ACP methyl ester carboxylesterase